MSDWDQTRAEVLTALRAEPGLRIGETFGTWACPQEWPTSVLFVGLFRDGDAYQVRLTRYDHPENDLARYSKRVVHEAGGLTTVEALVASAVAGVRAARSPETGV